MKVGHLCFLAAERMKKKDKYKRMKQDTRTDRDSLTSRMKKGKVSPYPGKSKKVILQASTDEMNWTVMYQRF